MTEMGTQKPTQVNSSSVGTSGKEASALEIQLKKKFTSLKSEDVQNVIIQVEIQYIYRCKTGARFHFSPAGDLCF